MKNRKIERWIWSANRKDIGTWYVIFGSLAGIIIFFSVNFFSNIINIALNYDFYCNLLYNTIRMELSILPPDVQVLVDKGGPLRENVVKIVLDNYRANFTHLFKKDPKYFSQVLNSHLFYVHKFPMIRIGSAFAVMPENITSYLQIVLIKNPQDYILRLAMMSEVFYTKNLGNQLFPYKNYLLMNIIGMYFQTEYILSYFLIDLKLPGYHLPHIIYEIYWRDILSKGGIHEYIMLNMMQDPSFGHATAYLQMLSSTFNMNNLTGLGSKISSDFLNVLTTPDARIFKGPIDYVQLDLSKESQSVKIIDQHMLNNIKIILKNRYVPGDLLHTFNVSDHHLTVNYDNFSIYDEHEKKYIVESHYTKEDYVPKLTFTEFVYSYSSSVYSSIYSYFEGIFDYVKSYFYEKKEAISININSNSNRRFYNNMGVLFENIYATEHVFFQNVDSSNSTKLLNELQEHMDAYPKSYEKGSEKVHHICWKLDKLFLDYCQFDNVTNLNAYFIETPKTIPIRRYTMAQEISYNNSQALMKLILKEKRDAELAFRLMQQVSSEWIPKHGVPVHYNLLVPEQLNPMLDEVTYRGSILNHDIIKDVVKDATKDAIKDPTISESKGLTVALGMGLITIIILIFCAPRV